MDFIQSAVQFMALIHPFTHIHTPTVIGCHARHQPARQEQLRVRCLAQGHFDTPRVGLNQQPCQIRLPDDCSYLLSHIAHSVFCSGLVIQVYTYIFSPLCYPIYNRTLFFVLASLSQPVLFLFISSVVFVI